MKYKDFTEFLNVEKFFKDEPNTLDDEWPDAYSDWLADQDCDTLVQYADEYASLRVIDALEDLQKTLRTTKAQKGVFYGCARF